HECLAGWLYKVAYRIAVKAKTLAAKRAARERQAVKTPFSSGGPDLACSDLRPVLDEEVNQLPEKYRVPFVLCYLEGKTTDEAGRQLGWPRGTVATRLAWARGRLRLRLARRGLALSGGALASLITQNTASAAVPPALMDAAVRFGLLDATGKGAAGAISDPVLGLAREAQPFLRLTLLKVCGVLQCVLFAVAAAFGLAIHQVAADKSGESRQAKPRLLAARKTEPAKPIPAQSVRTDLYGDPLPPGAVARMGTVRLRQRGWVGELAFSPDSK